MNKYICILRGINVGGHRKMLMKDLISLLEKSNFQNVKTYIQSGNIVFNSNLNSPDLIENTIKELIFETYKFDVPVIVITQEQIGQVIDSYPFDDEINVHVTFLKETPLEENRSQIHKEDYLPEQFLINDKIIYLKCGDKYHKTKLSNQFFEKKLKVSATTRNWKTVNKLLELVKV